MREEADYDVKRLEHLLDLMAEEDLDDTDVEELQEILLSSEQARARYINFNFVDDSLHWSYAEAALDKRRENDYFKNTVDQPKASKNFSYLWIAAAALLAVTFTLGALLASKKKAVKNTVAVLINGHEAVWEKALKKDLASGRIKLLAGNAKIIFNSGAEMSLTAPVEVDIKSHIHARLIQGKVKLYAPESAIGFRLETEASNFVDIGTEFEVSVDENNDSEIHVLEGVVVARSNYSDAVVPFGKNEAGRIDASLGKIVPLEKGELLNPLLAAKGENSPGLDKNSRVIFIGERNTDYETYMHMVNQALYDFSPANAPTLINAGLTYKLGGPVEDYKRFIKAMNPTHAVLAIASVRPSFSIDHNPGWFENRVNELCELLEKDNIIPVFHIGFPMSDKEPVLTHFNNYKRILLRIAEERSYKVARADFLWEEYRKAGKVETLAQAKGIRQTYTGHQLFARSILDAFGYRALEVPLKLRLKPLPGLISQWHWTEFENPEKLNAQRAEHINTSGWRPLTLPMAVDKGYTSRFINSYMLYETQAKALGFGLEMSGVYSNTIRAVGHFDSEGGDKVLNIGGGIKEIWLNGELIESGLSNVFIDGRHAGGRRFAVKLKAGKNTIVLDCTMNFFVSLTDDDQWGLQAPAIKE